MSDTIWYGSPYKSYTVRVLSQKHETHALCHNGIEVGSWKKLYMLTFNLLWTRIDRPVIIATKEKGHL